MCVWKSGVGVVLPGVPRFRILMPPLSSPARMCVRNRRGPVATQGMQAIRMCQIGGMNTPRCPRCHGMMKKNGSTSAGRTRWRCKDSACGASATRSYGRTAADLRAGLDWLFSKDSQAERSMPARSPGRANTLMWSLWPPVPLDRSAHDVVHIDGIHLHRKAVVPVPVADGHAVGWHVAGSETCAAWSPLLSRIAPPLAVVCDGGGGVPEALRTVWPSTRVQRCLFHVCMNITELTGLRPRLAAGRGLRKAAVAPVSRLGRRFRGGMAGIVQPVGTGPQGVPRPEKPLGGRHRRRPAPASRQGAPDDPQTHPRGTPVHVRRTAGGVRDADPSDEQPHRVMERTHPRHASPAPGPVPGAADQGGVLVVPPAHHGSGTRRVARGQRRHGRTN